MTKFSSLRRICKPVIVGALLVFITVSSFAQITPNGNGVVFVNKNVSGGNQSGNSWTNAVTELADALLAAYSDTTIHQIWVAKGTYNPLYSAGDDGMQNPYMYFGSPYGGPFDAFLLVKNVKLYGGFQNADETSISQRDTINNNTYLSGDDSVLHVVMSVGNVGTAEINGFTISGGKGSPTQTFYVNSVATYATRGSGIYIQNSAPIISNCVITDNHGEGGGGIYADNSTLTVRNSTINNNSAKGSSGGMTNSITVGLGGGISAINCDNITISNTTISNDTTTSVKGYAYGGGIWINNWNGSFMTCNISNTTISNNAVISTAASSAYMIAEGGGLGAEIGGGNQDGIINISNSTISGNSVSLNDTVSGNPRYDGCAGGGIYTSFSAVMNNCIVSDNHISANKTTFVQGDYCSGGGITNASASFVINNSVIENNSSEGNCNPSGGGVSNGHMFFASNTTKINNSIIRNNATSGYGGGLCNLYNYKADLKNTLIVDNSATHNGGAICNEAGTYGPTQTTLINCTLSGNTVSDMGGMNSIYNANTCKTFVHNSIIFPDKGDNNGNALVDTATEITYSIVQGSPIYPGIGNKNENPLFVNSTNGDYSLQTSSPAANAGNNVDYTGNINSDSDLAGNARLYENTIDMGAYELQVPTTNNNDTSNSVVSLTDNYGRMQLFPNPVQAGQPVNLYFDCSANMLNGAQLTISDATGRIWKTFHSIRQKQSLISPSASGIYFVTVTLKNGKKMMKPVVVNN